MAIRFSPNRRVGSKEVWTVLLKIEGLVSRFVFVPGTAISGLVMGSGV